jgi:hypothetical protein
MAMAALPALADSRIKVGTVPALYEPLGSMYSQPVSLAGYHFEANPETGLARVVVNYSFPVVNPRVYDPGPEPTMAQIPGLTWNAATRSVVYEANGHETVCAVAQPGKSLKLENTGACTVTATEGEQTTSDGWNLHHFKAIDTWLEVN